MAESDSPDQEPEQELAAEDLKGTLKLLSDQVLPLEVGSVQVSETGQIETRDSAVPVAFTFEYQGVRFDAAFQAEQGATLKLFATLGRIPFTAECGEARWLILRLVRAANALPHGRVMLNGADEIVFEAEATPPAPRTPVSLMATVTAILLDLKPYMDVFGDTLKQQAPAPAG